MDEKREKFRFEDGHSHLYATAIWETAVCFNTHERLQQRQKTPRVPQATL